jgi:hypothetical protein
LVENLKFWVKKKTKTIVVSRIKNSANFNALKKVLSFLKIKYNIRVFVVVVELV